MNILEHPNNLHLGALMHGGIPGEEHFGFSLFTTKSEEKGELLLRVTKVDDMIKWMNAIAEAAQLDYDPNLGVWSHAAREKRRERQERLEKFEKQKKIEVEEAKKKRQAEIQKKMKEQSEELRKQKDEEEAVRKQLRENEEKKRKLREAEEERLRTEKMEKMKRVAAKKMVRAYIHIIHTCVRNSL